MQRLSRRLITRALALPVLLSAQAVLALEGGTRVYLPGCRNPTANGENRATSDPSGTELPSDAADARQFGKASDAGVLAVSMPLAMDGHRAKTAF